MNDTEVILVRRSNFLRNKESNLVLKDSSLYNFPFRGSQGLVGVVANRVFKVSKYPDFLVNHEYEVMKEISTIREWCPNFCGLYDLVEEKVCLHKNSLSFKNKGKMYHRNFLLIEYLEDSVSLTSQLPYLHKNSIFSILKQLLLSIKLAQTLIQFVHYDLHTDNVLLMRCEERSVILYRLESGSYLVPTYGRYPVIIDYGFSYHKNLNGKHLFGTMEHTDAGYLTCVYDKINDLKVLMTSISKDLKDFSPEDYEYFRRKVRDIFVRLNIDWRTGWDNEDECSASKILSIQIKEYERKKSLKTIFSRYSEDSISIIQSIVTLPLVDKGNDDVIEVFKVFSNEWRKIEESFTRDTDRTFALSQLLVAMRECNNSEDDLRKLYLYRISRDFPSYELHQRVNFSKLLRSLIELGDRISTTYFRVMKKIQDKKTKEYNQLHFADILEFYKFFDANFSTPIQFTKETIIYVCDSIEKKLYTIKELSQETIDKLNSSKSIYRGEIILDSQPS